MARKNQPKRQRTKKIPAGQKRQMRDAVRFGGGTYPEYIVNSCNSTCDEPIQKILSYGSGYGWAGMHPSDLAAKIKKAVEYFGVLKSKMKIDAIAYTGSSGAAIAFPLAIAHEIPIIYVRKEGERSHGTEIECNYTEEIETYIVVDDFIATGNTIRRVMSKIKDRAKRFSWDGPECLGVLVFDPRPSDGQRFALQDEDYKPTGEVVDVFNTF